MVLTMLGGEGTNMLELQQEWKDGSAGEEERELTIPGGRGQGPNKTIGSKWWSYLVCCRIVPDLLS